MARKRRGHRAPVWKRALRAVGGIGTGALIASPVLYPGVVAATALMQGATPQNAWGVFTYEAAGVTNTGTLDQGKLAQVAGRDIALVAIGMGLRWALKRV